MLVVWGYFLFLFFKRYEENCRQETLILVWCSLLFRCLRALTI
ncbi:rCG23263 [Rattus norvegicus]|uniref:RCG23263 n=1 Tax=Rattus norvegicus TaxID=10116 RepID=A6JQ00_RAT|nr:rCG23263 [Rattus norvegicus]